MKTGVQGVFLFFHSIGDGGIVKVFDNQQYLLEECQV